MAKIAVKNFREHAIHVSTNDKEVVTVTFPHANYETNLDRNGNARQELVPSTTVVDSSFIELAKKNVVVAEYFKLGWLRVEDADDEAPLSKQQQAVQDKKDQSNKK